jgi:carboxymethylenebutenolidase
MGFLGALLMRNRMAKAWAKHTASEFEEKSVTSTMDTMGGDPAYVVNVPTCVGGAGKEGIETFYANKFVGKTPADTTTTSVQVSIDVKAQTLVEELVMEFTHDIEMPWMLPGVPPSGKKVTVPLVVSVGFDRRCQVVSERVYWDQASVLQQVGLLPLDKVEKLPIVGSRQSKTVLDPKREIGARCE